VAASDELVELPFQAGELALTILDVMELVEKQVVDMRTGSLPLVAEAHDARDLDEGESGSLGAADELKTGDGRGVVVAVTVRAASRRREQTTAFVEADGLARQADGVGHFPDSHDHHLSGQVCKFVGDQAAVGWALSRVWVCCRSSLSRRSARSLVVNFHLKGVAASL
jgi:hypothetical protein